MKKLNTSPISGTQELLPGAQALFDDLKSKIASTYKSHGFLNVETPILERTEILFAKAGGDTEKQIYEVKKTGESAEDKADQALRFDHTVPLARYIVEHESDLAFPFKVAQVGENFRGERAQKGRFREFYQCDADVIGRGELPLFYDADIIATLFDAYQSFSLNTPVIARISNRKILKGFLEGLNLEDKSKDISSIIDHAEKVAPEKTDSSLVEIGLTPEQKDRVLSFISLSGSLDTVINGLRNLGVSSVTLDEGIAELTEVFHTLELAGANSIVADLKIIRGLDYYTGTVFEFALPEHPEVGSIGGGGRYDNLAEYFTEQKFPGVGGSIGLNRLFAVLTEKNLLNAPLAAPVDYAVIPITDAEIAYALSVAKDLREKEHAAVTLVPGDKKLGDKLKYAAKIAKNAIVIGENEAKTGEYVIKNLEN